MKPDESTKKRQGLADMGRQILDVGTRLDLPDTALAAILLALRSLLWPYLGLVHDAKLYAFQAFNHSQDGKFAQDLFFAFGSQDSYSVFSLLMGPLVSWIGLKAAFWAVYMLSSALLAYAEVRLVRRLVPDRRLANLGLVALAPMILPYGGWGFINVHESFLTARLPAQGLALLGIESTLQGRWFKALILILTGMALHPLMAVGALAVLVAVFAWNRVWPRNKLAWMLPTLGGSVILVFLNWELLNALLGVMDSAWLAAVKKISWHCFLSQWRLVDWYWLVGSHALVLWGCRWLKPEGRRLAYAAVLVSAGGLIITAMGEFLSSPLLLQGQGYRSVWLTEVLVVPLGVIVANQFSRASIGRWALLAIIFFLGDPFMLNPGIASVAPLLLAIYISLSVFWAAVSYKKNSANWVDASWQGMIAGMVSGSVILSSLVIIAVIRLGVSARMDPIVLVYDAAISCSPLALYTILLLGLGASLRLIKDQKSIAVWAVSVWVVLSLTAAIVREQPKWRAQFQPGYSDLTFVESVFDTDEGDKARSTKVQIYWPVDSTLTWFDLQKNCYYNLSQLAGIVFSKETATEGVRRAVLVRFFEVAQMRMDKVQQSVPAVRMQLELSGGTFDDRPPMRKDLLRLAEDETLDWIVLYDGFDDLYCATNGSVYVYDCHAIRAQRGSDHSDSSSVR